MNLKPQDVLIALKLLSPNAQQITRSKLAQSLGMSASEVQAGLQRASKAQLLRRESPQLYRPIRFALEEFLIHGLKYAFFAERGALTRGFPTAYAAAPLKELLVQNNEYPPVWADANGTARGTAITPLYPSVTFAIQTDQMLYEWLALVDTLRIGAARERNFATHEIRSRLSQLPKGNL